MKIKMQTQWEDLESNREFIEFLVRQNDSEFRIDLTKINSGAEGEFLIEEADGKLVYLLLVSFFSYSSSSDFSIMVMNMDLENPGFILVLRDEFRDVANETPNTYSKSELLSAEHVFLSVWPDIILRAAEDIDLEDEQIGEGETELVVIDESRENLFHDLLGDPETIRDEVSFFVYGASIFEVMDRIAFVPSYENEINERLISEIPAIDSDIVAVVFETNLGDVVDLRVPLPQGSRSEALRRVAEKAKALEATVYIVIGESEYGDEFTVQKLIDGGLLLPPEKLAWAI